MASLSARVGENHKHLRISKSTGIACYIIYYGMAISSAPQIGGLLPPLKFSDREHEGNASHGCTAIGNDSIFHHHCYPRSIFRNVDGMMELEWCDP
jgi:hypothetical protein